MMMALGDFIFELGTVPYQSQQRSGSQRLAENLPAAGNPSYQALGRGADRLTLPGVLYPEVTGAPESLDELREMMNTGEPYLMIDGQGFVQGYWFIESIDETRSELYNDGSPQKIEFTLRLTYSYETRVQTAS